MVIVADSKSRLVAIRYIVVSNIQNIAHQSACENPLKILWSWNGRVLDSVEGGRDQFL